MATGISGANSRIARYGGRITMANRIQDGCNGQEVKPATTGAPIPWTDWMNSTLYNWNYEEDVLRDIFQQTLEEVMSNNRHKNFNLTRFYL